jgi:MFS transporter, DHA1 family, staphyloferrin A biosynthesis exporter
VPGGSESTADVAPGAPVVPDQGAVPTRLRDTAFPLLWLNVFSYMLIGSAERFTFVWLVMEELDGPSWASGLVLFALGLPVFLFVLPGGALADRVDRRRMLMVTQLAGAAVTGMAALLVIAGVMNLPLALLCAALLGAAIAFGQPVRGSLVPTVVPKPLLMQAIVLITIGMNVAMIVGPVVGGLIIRRYGIGAAFAAEAALFVVGFLTLIPLRLPVRQVAVTGRIKVDELMSSIREGLAFVWHHPTLRSLFAMLMVGGFLMMGASNLLVPEIAHDVFEKDADEASRLFAFMGGGMMITSIFLLARGSLKRKGLVFLCGMVVGTTLQFLMGFAPTYAFLAALLFMWGASGGFYLNLNQTLIQSATPHETMGRVMALHSLCQVGLAPIGSLVAGVIASGFGPQVAMSVFGAVGIGIAVLTLMRATELRST